MQGLGFGGEWAAGAVLMGEVIGKRARGRAVGTVQAGWSVGYGAAVLLFTVVFSLVSPELAWRLLFFVGLIPAVFTLWIRRNVEEPELFSKMRASAPSRGTFQFLEIFRPPLLRRTVLASTLAMGGLGGNYTILTWLATYLVTVRNLSVLGTGGYLAVNICGSFCGYVCTAHVSDWLGRRKTFVIAALCAAATVATYTLAPLNDMAVLLLGFPLGFFQSGIIAGMGATFGGAVSDASPGYGTGLLLQHRPGGRLDCPRGSGIPWRQHRSGTGDRHLRRICLHGGVGRRIGAVRGEG